MKQFVFGVCVRSSSSISSIITVVYCTVPPTDCTVPHTDCRRCPHCGLLYCTTHRLYCTTHRLPTMSSLRFTVLYHTQTADDVVTAVYCTVPHIDCRRCPHCGLLYCTTHRLYCTTHRLYCTTHRLPTMSSLRFTVLYHTQTADDVVTAVYCTVQPTDCR